MNKTIEEIPTNGFLIVGQGLAGSILARELLRAGVDVTVIDQGHEKSSSSVAAGIINPITGRYFVKSWLIDNLIPAARNCYQALEQELNVSLWTDRTVLRALPNERSVNEWQTRSNRPGWNEYMTGIKKTQAGLQQFKEVPLWGVTSQAAQVDLPLLLDHSRSWFNKLGVLVEEEFDFDQIKFSDNTVIYKKIRYDGVIFADGSEVRKNPYFKFLPFRPVKGEVVHLEMPDLPADTIIKYQLLFAPLKDGRYWAGANYDHNFNDHLPSNTGIDWLTTKLKQVLNISVHIKDHKAGIRPSVKDRKPIIGKHPNHRQLYLFNGFGTKGTSLIPYFARKFKDWVLDGKPLPEEVQIERFHQHGSLT